MLGVHVIAVFQVLIYVGAVMVFMVYVIMLLDVRDRSFTRRSRGCSCRESSASLLLLVVLAARLVAGAAGTPARRRRRTIRRPAVLRSRS